MAYRKMESEDRIVVVEPLPILPALQRGAYSPSVQRWPGRRPSGLILGDIHADHQTPRQSLSIDRGIRPGIWRVGGLGSEEMRN